MAQELNYTYLFGISICATNPARPEECRLVSDSRGPVRSPQAKPQIEKAAEYFYNKYHGKHRTVIRRVQTSVRNQPLSPDTDNLIRLRRRHRQPTWPRSTDRTLHLHLKTLSLGDQEFILFNGKPEDAAKVSVRAGGHRTRFRQLLIWYR